MSWIESFPELSALEPAPARLISTRARTLHIAAGTRIFGPGQAPESYLLLLSGSVRVQQTSGSGREIVLYRVTAGQSCPMTTSCLMGHEDYLAEGIAETELLAVTIPRETFDELIATSAAFRRFVFRAFSHSVTTLFRLIEDVAFSRIDVRLAEKLVDLAGSDGRVAKTHQQLASELGSAREVVSRQLHEFQRHGWLETARGAIVLLDPAALSRLARAS